MDVKGSLKKFASDATTAFSRAVQFTEERFGHAEKTEYDAHFENLLQRADQTKLWTERILKQTETLLQPNPGIRLGDLVYDRVLDKKRQRLTNAEQLGQYMGEAGMDFGSGTSYGNALIKCGQTQKQIGSTETEFLTAASTNFLEPLRQFLDGDMKTVMKERKHLEVKRLDLDACKARLRKAKSQSTQSNADNDLRKAQLDFDRQLEVTKLLLEGINSAHAHHLRCLNDFIEGQACYHNQCHQYMKDLQRQLGSYSVPTSDENSIYPPAVGAASSTKPSTPNGQQKGDKKARVLYDYDAADKTELSLIADEMIVIWSDPKIESDWYMARKGSMTGKVPQTYVEVWND